MKNLISILFILIPTTIVCQQSKTPDKQTGYQNYTSYGQLIGSGRDNNTIVSSIQMEHNYLFNKNFAFGLTTGLEWMDINMATIGGNIKIIFPTTNKQSVYFGASLGRVIPLDDAEDDWRQIKNTHGGDFINTEIGYVFPTKGVAAFYTAIGYRFQEYSYSIEDWWLDDLQRSVKYNRFLIRIGLRIF
ncbi:hypothetical protein [Plebeiibacterium marinum]|uniref:Uncharacterized protein n=1 Tax=Plebeiibacterium marinum TaxID=2992111 RepID=A0AAE3MFD1_9BACT|nr:hypothetical protein [Plebeiobacterium marinum]MCW3806562.1 hypothetical protein [Plebeiobacterium marinum]